MLRPVGSSSQQENIDLTRLEEDAFWSWAIVHLLHQVGLRIEELLELDQFSIQRWRHPQSGEVIPLLHVYPSKTDKERLIVASSELVHVLAQIVHRLRQPDGTLPLTRRYDSHEHEVSPAAPLLFQRKIGTRYQSMSYQYVYQRKSEASDWAGIRRITGSDMTYTPHDLRRIFATDAQNSGVSIHVIAALLGHESIETTQSYAAVYPETVITEHGRFIVHRRAQTPGADQREVTEEEWGDFQGHFIERKLSLGSCGRSWGSSCQHEHARVRCSLLRPDPDELDRFVDIRDNVIERIAEAREYGWTGEVEGLEITLAAANEKIARIESLRAEPDAPTILGLLRLRPRES